MEEQKEIKKNDNKWKFVIYFSVVIFLVFLLFSIPYLFFYYKTEKPIEKEKEITSKCEDCTRRKIDGVYVKNGEDNYQPVAVVIDNHTEARPQAGLSKANLVYEVEAEGNITRYLAIFADGKTVEKIGPIRSARPYFIDWLSEFSALFMHCGGSPEALVKIKKENVNDLNEFYNSTYFWRDKTKLSSHDLFTSSEKIKEYLNDKKTTIYEYETWKYKDDLSKASSSEISFSYREPFYDIKWIYQSENNDYLRYLSEKPHTEEDGSEIRAKNVIIQFAETEVLDKELRLKIKTIDKNKAIICLDGICRKGEWKKKA